MNRIKTYARRPWVVMPLVALLALGGWWVLRPDDASTTTATSTDRLLTATSGSMAKTVSAEGSVEAAETEDLNFDSAGTVTAVNV